MFEVTEYTGDFRVADQKFDKNVFIEYSFASGVALALYESNKEKHADAMVEYYVIVEEFDTEARRTRMGEPKIVYCYMGALFGDKMDRFLKRIEESS